MLSRWLIVAAVLCCVAVECRCSRITDEDVEEAFNVAYQKVLERIKQENKLAAKGKTIDRTTKTADASINRAFKTDPITRRKYDVQLPLEFATGRLDDRFSLTPDELALDLPRKELKGSMGQRANAECQEVQDTPTCNPEDAYRTADGTCNNLGNPTWGRALGCFQRLQQPYYDGYSGFRGSVRGGSLPSPRSLSLNLHSHLNRPTDYVNHMFMFFGQLLDHDISFTPIVTTNDNLAIQCCPANEENHPECAPILIGWNDPFYSNFGIPCLNFVRSTSCPSCTLGHRNQISQVTALIDGSFLYGNSENETFGLRLLSDGLMRSQYSDVAGELLPSSPDPANDQCSLPDENNICFEAGDTRANQHPPLTSLHTIFLREHNSIAMELKRLNPWWTDERVFQETRRIVGAEMQAIAYGEYLPITLGSELMSYYRLWLGNRGTTSYNPNINPTMFNEFSTAAFRYGHSLINTVLAQNWPNGQNQLLRDSYFEPFSLYDGAIDPLMCGTTDSPSQSFDRHLVPDVTNYLYRIRGNDTGLDLASFNIQRGRDHGMPPYTAMVQYCSDYNIRVESFDDLVYQGLMPTENADLLRLNYRHVDDIDLWTGIISEISNNYAMIGPTGACIVGTQFNHLKFGDRFYFEHQNEAGSFTFSQIDELRQVTLTTILCANSRITALPRNAMLYHSDNNPLLYCNYIRRLDLSYWKEW